MRRPDSALLFAAGFGTRMAPLTDRLPKPLIPVAGAPLFDHALRLVRRAGISRIVANTHYLAPQMSAHLRKAGVTESHEPTILDTGGGLKNALPLLSGPAVVTLNTDAVWAGGDPVGALLAAWNPDLMDALLVLVPREKAVGHNGPGDFLVDPVGGLTLGPGSVYTGLQIVRTAPFLSESEPVFGMMRVWKRLLDTGRMYGLLHTGGWCDVGRPDCIPLAEAMIGHADV